VSGDGPAAVVPPRSPGAPRIPDAVRRVFAETFTARDVAEPLASFDAETPAAEVRAFMEDRGFDAVGVRSKGHVVGFVRSDSLENGTCGQRLQPLDEATVLCDSAPLLTVLQALNQVPFVLVAVLGKVGGIITRSDLQKAPLRMWLFGVVTMIEMRFTDLIEQHCPADGWTALLSEARGIRNHTVFASRRQAEEAVKRLEQLRNNLAHAQEIGGDDWAIVAQLCDFIARQ
jgi:predicted transcriptional regulator